jgi:triphosphoribosyl-dephospho-CoA synthase
MNPALSLHNRDGSVLAVACNRSVLAVARNIGRLAVRSLHAELVLYPKPGLVSLRDNGAHRDMNAATFMRSLFALRHYFAEIAIAGMRGARMAELRRLGVAAETRMLRATGGINTHRGSIFALGLLSAAAGRASIQGDDYSDAVMRSIVTKCWRRDLLAVPASAAEPPSHGRQAAARYGVSGARGEAVRGFPGVFEIALPALRIALARGADDERARLHAFFSLLAVIDDTNVLYRAGADGLRDVQRSATDFIVAGGVFADDWLSRAEALHRQCSRQRISPGGCADLLACAFFVHQLQTGVR